ncbi:MAG: prepilin-type N-terminal cleavage/methylation domain-containing protein [Deltaproteobacteria bacterium]|nr:prepilin-type N-terminal cleavage/methylation domain-containing protein [Deltaproteobacteria bacterium]
MRNGINRRNGLVPRSRKLAGGFTLLEVLVALAILSSVLVIAYRVMTDAIAAEARSEHWTTASYLGEALMREATSTFPDVGETTGRFAPPDDAYSWVRAVRQAPHADAVEVHVTVKWSEGGREEKVELAGIAAK